MKLAWFFNQSHIHICVWNDLNGQSLHDWDHEMWIFFVTGEWRSNTNCDGPILSSKFTQHCSSIPRSLSDFLDPYFHSHFFVFTQYCLLSNKLWIHNEIKKLFLKRKTAHVLLWEICSFVLNGSAQEQTQRFLYENSIHAFKVTFSIGGTTCDISINRLSTRGPLKLLCVIGLVLVIDVLGCHEIPGKSWWGWNQCWLASLSCTCLSSPHISKLTGEFCRFHWLVFGENSFCISGHSMSTRLVHRSTTLYSFVITQGLISLSIL